MSLVDSIKDDINILRVKIAENKAITKPIETHIIETRIIDDSKISVSSNSNNLNYITYTGDLYFRIAVNNELFKISVPITHEIIFKSININTFSGYATIDDSALAYFGLRFELTNLTNNDILYIKKYDVLDDGLKPNICIENLNMFLPGGYIYRLSVYNDMGFATLFQYAITYCMKNKR